MPGSSGFALSAHRAQLHEQEARVYEAGQQLLASTELKAVANR
jgi:hypothetical protein